MTKNKSMDKLAHQVYANIPPNTEEEIAEVKQRYADQPDILGFYLGLLP